MLSRNFRLQKVGGLQWLKHNINFSDISYSIDELVVLNITRGGDNQDEFCEVLKKITHGCFVPIAAGGGVRSVAFANKLLRSGADKIVINSALYEDSGFIAQLAGEFGQQCVVAAMDIKAAPDSSYQVWSECGSKCNSDSAAFWIKEITQNSVGELYLNSIDRDGTGYGYDFRILELLPSNLTIPVILAGGAGNAGHLSEGLSDSRVDAVATANLLNFIGDGLKQARKSLISNGIALPFWENNIYEE